MFWPATRPFSYTTVGRDRFSGYLPQKPDRSEAGSMVISMQVAGQIERHHMPANSVGPLSTGRGSAILMEKADHMMTASWGSCRAAKAYGVRQKELIGGDPNGAQQMDIDDVTTQFPGKYDEAIGEMQDVSNR